MCITLYICQCMHTLAYCCNTMLQVKDYNDFLHSALTHNSLAKIWRYFSNYETEAPLPLLEVTVDTCCFGSSTR